MTNREKWKSPWGFFLSAVGSAVGLMNIWKFPYIVGKYGGASFLILYLLCLFFVGLPLLISEIILGRATQANPPLAFEKLGGRNWSYVGKGILLLGLMISSFYSVVAGKVFGYLVEAAFYPFQFQTIQDATLHYQQLESSHIWSIFFHAGFLSVCFLILYRGIRRGIEWGNRLMMPVLFFLLLFLTVRSFFFPQALKGLSFLFSPNWRGFSLEALMIALGHACFTLSVGQGTMITYGSYLSSRENIPLTTLSIACVDTIISLLISITLFATIFSVGLLPDSGPGLLFHTLPYVFSYLSGGYFLSIFFFFIVLLAAIGSEISVMEPCIAHLIDQWGWSRKKAVVSVVLIAFILGIPFTLSGRCLGWIDGVVSTFFLPLSALLTICFVTWKWGILQASEEFFRGTTYRALSICRCYFICFFKYVTPLSILFILFIHFLFH